MHGVEEGLQPDFSKFFCRAKGGFLTTSNGRDFTSPPAALEFSRSPRPTDADRCPVAADKGAAEFITNRNGDRVGRLLPLPPITIVSH